MATPRAINRKSPTAPDFSTTKLMISPATLRFFLQLAIYLVSLTLMKIGVILLFYLCAEKLLLPFAGWLIGWMGEDVQVIVVMAVFPLIMNVLQVSRFCWRLRAAHR